MLDQINNYKREIKKLKITDVNELENFRVKFISKKSLINDLFKQGKLRDLSTWLIIAT